MSLSACQKAAETTEPSAASADAPAGSAAAVERILAMPVMERCGSDWPGHTPPTAHQVIDLGEGAFAVLTDCYPNDDQPAWKTLHVQGADGVLKAQPLIIYNGPEYDEGYDWEVSPTSEARWDSTARQLVWAYTLAPGDEEPATQVRTMRWRWDGEKMAMVEAGRAMHATPNAPATAPVTGWPTTPATPDPTPAATAL
ncbi:MAG: hypothetical protein KJ824_16820 [Alphaproteobacteria bacterium]|nr:hypothetical protein [Alphaproteobacteria bacterium]